MKTGETYWTVIDPIWKQVTVYDGPKIFLSEFSKITHAQKVLFSTHWAKSEVDNGGLHQFFHNSTGVLAPEAVDGFKALGMPKCAASIQRAMAFFGPKYPRTRETRVSKLEDNPKHKFETEDDEFWDHADAEVGGYEVAADRFALHNGK